MAARTSLRDYQRDLSERLQSAKGAANASLLGVQVDDEAWLVDLREAGEVIPVPPVTPLPLTRPWFRGLANIRGDASVGVTRPVEAAAGGRWLLVGGSCEPTGPRAPSLLPWRPCLARGTRGRLPCSQAAVAPEAVSAMAAPLPGGAVARPGRAWSPAVTAAGRGK